MLYDLWRQTAAGGGGNTALIDLSTGRRWSFAELDQAAASGARATPAEPVIFAQGSGSDFVLQTIRAWRAGSVLCPLEYGQAAPQLSDLPSECVHVKTTSASAGPPRFILFNAEQLRADAANIVRTMGLTPEAPNIAFISLAHSYGFSNLILPLLLHGIPLVLGGDPLPENVRSAAKLCPRTTLPAVPVLWKAWLEADCIPDSIALAISAGAPLPLALEKEISDRHGLKIHNFYGASECGGIAFDTSAAPRSEATLAGEPLHGVELRIGEGGQLDIHSQAAGLRYWPELDPALEPGLFHSADLAAIQQGRLHLLGRASDLINVAGRKVNPDNIEAILRQIPGVRQCVVFGVPDPLHERHEKIVACVECGFEAEPGQTLLTRHLLQALPAWQIPRHWWFVDKIEANARGKVSRAEWRKKFLAR